MLWLDLRYLGPGASVECQGHAKICQNEYRSAPALVERVNFIQEFARSASVAFDPRGCGSPSPRRSRAQHSASAGDSSDPRQLCHPHPSGRRDMVCGTPPLSPALHAHQCLLAEPGGTFLRRDYRQAHPTGNLPQRGRTGPSYPRLHPPSQLQPPTFRVDCLSALDCSQGQTL